MEKEAFIQRMGAGVWAISTGETVWIFGTGASARQVPLPKGGADICPMSDELADAAASLMALRFRLPDVKYRLSLKPKADGDVLQLDIIRGRDRFSFSRVREVVRKVVAEKRTTQELAQLKKPKIKRFKPTVVFYDGNIISKSMNGVTRVPRSFEYRGTSRGKSYEHASDIVSRERQKWENLRAEAERQERKARDVEAENMAAQWAYERKREEISRNVSVREQEIDAELKKYNLLIERSRTKVSK